MKDIFILDCPEISCPLVMIYVFTEFCGCLRRRGNNVKIIKQLSEIHNDCIVLMGNYFHAPNPVELLYKQAPNAIYLGWYWHGRDVSTLKNFTHIYENYKNIERDGRIRFLSKIPNSIPLLLRADEDPKDIGSYKRIVTRDYCYMGCPYCQEFIPTSPFTGIYHYGGWKKYLSYNERRDIYLSSTFALGFQSQSNIDNEHVSQRIYEGMAYGCVVLTNSQPAVDQTNGVPILFTSKHDLEEKMHYYLDHPEELKKKQEDGYEFVRKYGTNEYTFNYMNNNNIFKCKMNNDLKITLNNLELDNFILKNHDYLVDKRYYDLPSGKQEYRLYSYLTTFFNNSVILDIETSQGRSAVALSHNESNKVISYNILDQINNPNHKIYTKKNIEFRIANILDDLSKDLISNCHIVLIDIDHYEVTETKIIKRLYELGFSGIILLDDIDHPWPDMKKAMHRLWNSITYEKYDITKYGHFSGTGLILMNCKYEIILE